MELVDVSDHDRDRLKCESKLTIKTVITEAGHLVLLLRMLCCISSQLTCISIAQVSPGVAALEYHED